MAIKPSVAVAATTLTLLAFAAPAQAELQTWRLTATTHYAQAGLSGPAFADIGYTFAIDFVIETQVPHVNSIFAGAVKSFTLEGLTSQADGFMGAYGGGPIYIEPRSQRSDGVDLVHLMNSGGPFNADVPSALNAMSMSVSNGSSSLQVFFGDYLIAAAPSSFVMTSPVPEPSAAWLLLAGLPLLALKRGRRTTSA